MKTMLPVAATSRLVSVASAGLAPGTAFLVGILPALIGCSTDHRDDLDYSYAVQQRWSIEEIPGEQLVQFESVSWNPDATLSLRRLIAEDQIASGRNVLEVGTETGLVSLLCLLNGANSVVAVDSNPAAVANARYNAAMMAMEKNLDVRLVPRGHFGAFESIADDERFDLILAHLPWDARGPGTDAGQSSSEAGNSGEHQSGSGDDPNQAADGPSQADQVPALPGSSWAPLASLLDGLPTHLSPGGRCLLALTHAPTIDWLRNEASRRSLGFTVLDDRSLDELPKDFLPGMLVEIRANNSSAAAAGGAR